MNIHLQWRDLILQEIDYQNISHKELAKRLGISQPLITKWLAERHNPTVATMDAISNALNLKFLITAFMNQPKTSPVVHTIRVNDYTFNLLRSKTFHINPQTEGVISPYDIVIFMQKGEYPSWHTCQVSFVEPKVMLDHEKEENVQVDVFSFRILATKESSPPEREGKSN